MDQIREQREAAGLVSDADETAGPIPNNVDQGTGRTNQSNETSMERNNAESVGPPNPEIHPARFYYPYGVHDPGSMAPTSGLEPGIYPDMAAATMQFYESRMRDHAAAYANAAAGAAWAAAQMAAAAADFASGNGPPPPGFVIHAGNPPCQGPPDGNVAAAVSTGAFFGPQQHPLTFSGPNPMKMPQGYPQGVFHPQNPHVYQFYNPNPSMVPLQQAPSQAYCEHNNDDSVPIPENRIRDNESDDEDSFLEQSRSPGRPRHRPRKRQQRLPPDSVPRVLVAPRQQQQQNPQQRQQRGKVRRRILRSDNDGDSSCSTSSNSIRLTSPRNGSYRNSRRNSQESKQRKSSRRLEKRARSDESLLGKTAVAALYEWCSRRHQMPSFVLQQVGSSSNAPNSTLSGEGDGLVEGSGLVLPYHFDCSVYLDDDDKCWGRGQGRNKGAARQEAARQALSELCKGVVFDKASGFVVALNNTEDGDLSSPVGISTASSFQLEDLAPHLAKQLAIGSSSVTPQVKRSLENNEGSNQSNVDALGDLLEGAGCTSPQDISLLADLFFVTNQISRRTPELPTFSYHIDPVVVATKRSNAKAVGRGRFTCLTTLRVLEVSETRNDASEHPESTGKENQLTESVPESQDQTDKVFEDKIITAEGVGSSKREARRELLICSYFTIISLLCADYCCYSSSSQMLRVHASSFNSFRIAVQCKRSRRLSKK